MENAMQLSDLMAYTDGASAVSRKDDDYLVVRLTTRKIKPQLPTAFSIDCVSIFLCLSGKAVFNVSFSPVELTAGTIIVINPNNLIELDRAASVGMDCCMIFLSRDLINMMSLDSNALEYSRMQFSKSTPIVLDSEQFMLAERYFDLLSINAATNTGRDVYSRNITISLAHALIYQLLSFSAKASVPEGTVEKAYSGRRSYYVKDFMKLVKEHFRENRTVYFYADKLFISPKYLSLLIKEATGYTATDWIDHYVILEAKNLLRFSSRSIQQIAYDLHFNNQSSFGKYFKHLTGMSPSEFRRPS